MPDPRPLIARNVSEGPHASTPNDNIDVRLTEIVGQLVAQIGESIVKKLMSTGVVNMSGGHQTASTDQSSSSRHDLLNVTIHIKPNKELQCYRGDDSDKCSIQDWIDMVKIYLKKQDIPVQEQADEIVSHLLGKDKDVVRISLQSDPDLDVTEKPELIYSVLLHYFSDAS